MAVDPALATFVNALQKRAGYKHASEWARDAGFPASNLSDVKNGNAGIDGLNLLRLIRAAAAKLEDDEIALALRAAEPSLGEAVLRLEAVVARLTAHLGHPPNAQGHGQPP
jgi:predicted transcriptional regulator